MSTAAKPPRSSAFDPDLRSALVAMVRKRVPESEVEDIVQQALAEAIESPHAPTDSESLRRWIFGVAKNKVVDYHRRAGRESFDLPDVEGTPAPHVEADLLRWAEKNLPEGAENKKTLDWMLREGEGEKLESIAESEKLPPPRVRQRVSRLRRHFKENWQREVALLAALGVIVSAVVIFMLKKDGPEPITHDIVDPRAEKVRRLALERCAHDEWKPCLEGLDEARRIDPAGDAQPEVQKARQAAGRALDGQPPLLDDNTPAPLPTTTAPAPTPSASFDSKVAPQASAAFEQRALQQQKVSPKSMATTSAPEPTSAPPPPAKPTSLLDSEPTKERTPPTKESAAAKPAAVGGTKTGKPAGASKKGGGSDFGSDAPGGTGLGAGSSISK
jgi:RNA polymerase sigma factor (sigma-70 family)